MMPAPSALRRYCIDVSPEEAAECLSDWSWLVPASAGVTPVLMTKFGDWCLADKDSKLHFLSLLEGAFTPLNASVNEMGDEGFLERFNVEFSVDPVELCLEQGRVLPEGMATAGESTQFWVRHFTPPTFSFLTVRVCQSLHEQLQRKH